jgi:nucleotide-binding universal stress UspA family protein
MKILLAVDGSESAARATRKLAEAAAAFREAPAIELVTVHVPVPYVGGFVGGALPRDAIERHYREEGEKALAPCKQVLDQANLRYASHILVGDVATAIAQEAAKRRCDMIYMGTRGMSAMANMLVGSTATKVVHLAPVPVVLVH